jgi:replicative superfamily II helicase
MITSTNFYQLSYQQQADILLANATFLLSRIEDSFIVDLYELDDILVEIFYEKDTEDLVSVMAYNTSEKLKVLTNGANLKPRLTIKKEGSSLQPVNEFFA